LSAGLSFCGVAVVRALAPRLGWMAEPRGDRWHRKATAQMGGVGFVPVLLGFGFWSLMSSLPKGWVTFFSPVDMWRSDLILASILLGVAMLFVAGWLDDRWELRPRTKLLFQLGAASQLIYFGGGMSPTGWPLLDAALSYAWLVGITNAVNLLDNMDGLCGGFVAIVFATLGFCWTGGESGAAICWIVAGASLGFLLHNFPPAKIFMGDAGSLPLGFLCAALSLPGILNGNWGRESQGLLSGLTPVVVASVLLAVPILDTFLVAITRILESKNPMKGGRDHTSHRLAALLASEKRSLIFFLGLAVATSLIFTQLRKSPALLAICLGGVFWLGLILLGNFLAGKISANQSKSPLVLRLLREWFRRYAIFPVLVDAVLILMLFPAGYYLRLDFQMGPQELEALRRSLPALLFAILGSGLLLGTYTVAWSQASSLDYLRQAVASATGVLLALAVLTLATRFEQGYSRSAFLIFGVLFLAGQAVARLSQELGRKVVLRAVKPSSRIPVLVYGAGKRGRLLAEACGVVPELSRYRVVAFFDDNEDLRGKRLDGVPILTPKSKSSLPVVEEIWVSNPSIKNHPPVLGKKNWDDLPVKRLILELRASQKN